jgi:glycosyltransferase involved in cell wall biosynthesis
MSKFIFLTNIPTPYRTNFYNSLEESKLNFEVFYMRNIEADRNWVINYEDIKHKFYIDKGIYKMIGRFHFHLNINIIIKIIKSKNSFVIIGGGWNDPDVLLLVLLKRLNIINNRFLYWTEANYMTIGASNDNLIKRLIRKYVYNINDAIQITSGKMTEITLVKWGIRITKAINLPNTIEEEKFIISNEELLLRNINEIPIFIMPVRLDEKIKGIINFFKGIGIENIKKAIFYIAGEGKDKSLIQNYISNNKLDENIFLLGHCSTMEIINIYKKANLFVLPSFSDPSPLSLIEALKMKLPVLVSERCGNHYEGVVESKNGFTFNPYESLSIKSAYENMLNSRKNWPEMANFSFMIYENKFNKNLVIKHFINELELL